MERTHSYETTITWKGNAGTGTKDYRAYSRDHEISMDGKPVIQGSSDPSFRGDHSKHSPEDLLVSSLSGCHMLWYLHLCASSGVVVTHYVDQAVGQMVENPDGSGQFWSVTLRPTVTVTEESMIEKAKTLHADAHRMCFIARSVNFPVEHLAEVLVEMNDTNDSNPPS